MFIYDFYRYMIYILIEYTESRPFPSMLASIV